MPFPSPTELYAGERSGIDTKTGSPDDQVGVPAKTS